MDLLGLSVTGVDIGTQPLKSSGSFRFLCTIFSLLFDNEGETGYPVDDKEDSREDNEDTEDVSDTSVAHVDVGLSLLGSPESLRFLLKYFSALFGNGENKRDSVDNWGDVVDFLGSSMTHVL